MSGLESQLAEIRARQREAYLRAHAERPQPPPEPADRPIDPVDQLYTPPRDQPWLDDDEALARRLQEEEDAVALTRDPMDEDVRAPMAYSEEPERLVSGHDEGFDADDPFLYVPLQPPLPPPARPAPARHSPPRGGGGEGGGGWLSSVVGQARDAATRWLYPTEAPAAAAAALTQEEADEAYARQLQEEERAAALPAAPARPPFRDPGIPLPPDLTQLFRQVATPQGASTRFQMQSPGGFVSFSMAGPGAQRTVVLHRGPNGTLHRVVHNHRLGDEGPGLPVFGVDDPMEGLDPFLYGLAPHDPVDRMSYDQLLALQDMMGTVPRGATQAQIDTLPCSEYSPHAPAAAAAGDTKELAAMQCHVCLDEFNAGDVLRTLPCLHRFHTGCIDRWLALNRTCPVCKADATHC